MKKENIGSAIILAGIAIIGFIWFKRNKPQTANKQLGDLTAQSNALQAGSVEGIDKPFEYSQNTINNASSNPYSESTFTMGALTPQQIKDIKNSIGTVFDPTTMASNQIAQNMQNANFTKLDGIIGVANIDWSKVKIK
jgi:hypothetical protein